MSGGTLLAPPPPSVTGHKSPVPTSRAVSRPESVTCIRAPEPPLTLHPSLKVQRALAYAATPAPCPGPCAGYGALGVRRCSPMSATKGERAGLGLHPDPLSHVHPLLTPSLPRIRVPARLWSVACIRSSHRRTCIRSHTRMLASPPDHGLCPGPYPRSACASAALGRAGSAEPPRSRAGSPDTRSTSLSGPAGGPEPRRAGGPAPRRAGCPASTRGIAGN